MKKAARKAVRMALMRGELNKYLQYYREQGLSAIPIPFRSKEATIKWGEFQKRLPTATELQEFFVNNNTNIAIVCGTVSGNLVVLDCESRAKYSELKLIIEGKLSIENLEEHTPVVKTSRGYHIYFRTPAPLKSQKFPNLEIRSEGNYVLAPPSIHPDGKEYQFLVPQIPDIFIVASLKDIGIDITQKPELPRNPPGWVSQALDGVPEGSRGDTCAKLAGYFRRVNLDRDVCEKILLDFATKCQPPLEIPRVYTTLDSIYRRYKPETQPAGGPRSLTSIMESSVELPMGLWGSFLFPQGIVFLSGEGGAGKTTFIWNLAGALSCGGEYLGFKILRPLSVLIYDLESPDGLIKGRVKLIGQINTDNIHLERFSNFRDDYQRLVNEGKGFDVTIVDTVSTAFKTKNEDDNAEAREEMKLARQFANDTGACLILLHHMGKMVGPSKNVYKARGASARPDLSDVVINFEAVTEDIIRFQQPKNRFVGGEITFFLKKEEGQFELNHFAGYADSLEIFKAEKAIHEYLARNPESARRAMEDSLDFSRATIGRALTQLLTKGEILKPRYGVYVLSSQR